MVERRKAQRTQTLKTGAVSFGVVAIVDCTIRNMSNAGACLEFPCRPILPRDFSMVIKPEYIRPPAGLPGNLGAALASRSRTVAEGALSHPNSKSAPRLSPDLSCRRRGNRSTFRAFQKRCGRLLGGEPAAASPVWDGEGWPLKGYRPSSAVV
jgi:hypothetical protein